MAYEVKTCKYATGSFRNDPYIITIHGPGCEEFIVSVPKEDTLEEAQKMATRIQTLLDHAYHAGYEHALTEVRAALGVKS